MPRSGVGERRPAARCRTISLREVLVSVLDRDEPGSRPPMPRTRAHDINSSADETRSTISWKGANSTGGARFEEISYLAIGPVSPPPAGPA